MRIGDLRNISWNINIPVSNIRIYSNENPDGIKLTKKDLSEKITGLAVGDKVVVCWSTDDSGKMIELHTETLRSNTLGGLLNTIYKGTHIKLTPKSNFNIKYKQYRRNMSPTTYVYKNISKFISKESRMVMADKFEKKGISPIELYGDHVFFEGIHKKGKYIYVAYGS